MLRPLASAASALPPAAMRLDPWAALTIGRYFPDLIQQGPVAAQLTGPFAKVRTHVCLCVSERCWWLEGVKGREGLCTSTPGSYAAIGDLRGHTAHEVLAIAMVGKRVCACAEAFQT